MNRAEILTDHITTISCGDCDGIIVVDCEDDEWGVACPHCGATMILEMPDEGGFGEKVVVTNHGEDWDKDDRFDM